MKSIRKLFNALAGSAVLSVAAAASNDVVFLPASTDPGWRPHFEVAALGGRMDFDDRFAGDGTTIGIELSLDHPLMTLPGYNVLREQVSLNRYDNDGTSLTTLEMNPYYYINIVRNLEIGFGPGISALYADPEHGSDAWLFGFQIGAGVKYYIDRFIIGTDLRRQWTTEDNFGGIENHALDNWRLLFKVGYRF